MNYIVFDLEWNQLLDENDSYNKDLPFEIIEIGAVKLDEKLAIRGMFSQIIKPKVYTQLQSITKELLDITDEELEKGAPFEQVYKDFIEFCGEDYVFCTWGDSDIYELLNNVQYFKVESPFSKPIKYLDIQRLYSRHNENTKNRVKLSTVIHKLNIRSNSEFHRAINDAKYTAMIMQHMDMDRLKTEYSIDTFFVPSGKEDEVFVKGDGYTRLLSRCFPDRTQLMEDVTVSSLRCPWCGRNCKRLIPWFLGSGKQSYFALGKCLNHGLVKGKIKTKIGPGDTYFALKKISKASPEDADDIREKKNSKAAQQRKKRHNRQLSGKR